MSYVPCNGCTACCRNQRIVLTDEEVRSGRYVMEPNRRGAGAVGQMLAHKSNGDCWYLTQNGCSIHGRAPTVCREFDCRIWLKGFAEEDWDRLGPLDKECADAARARLA